MQKWRANELSSILLKALCGSAARFLTDDASMEAAGRRWINEARCELLDSFDEPSLVKLQAMHLLVLRQKAERDFRKALTLSSLCSRYAFLLRLNYEDPSLPFLAQESRRRLMWSIWATDTFLRGGIPDFTLCRASDIHIRLPCEQRSFDLDCTVETERLSPPSGRMATTNIDLLAHYIRVVDLRDRILRYTKQMADSTDGAGLMTSQFATFEAELERVKASMSGDMLFSRKNLSLRVYSQDASLASFALVHVWWHQCYCDLTRFLVSDFDEHRGRYSTEIMPCAIRTLTSASQKDVRAT